MLATKYPTLARALLLSSLATTLSACAGGGESRGAYVPATTQPIAGSEIKQVTFTAEGAQRAGVQTSPVRRSGRERTIPYAALIYSSTGDTYTYVAPKPLVYLRRHVDVDRIVGDRVLIAHGPSAGASVVTTGAAEIYSAEFGVEQ